MEVKHILILKTIILTVLTFLILLSSNIKQVYDVKHEVDLIIDNDNDFNKSFNKLASDIEAHLPKNLEEKIFKLIFSRFYKKNNSIIAA